MGLLEEISVDEIRKKYVRYNDGVMSYFNLPIPDVEYYIEVKTIPKLPSSIIYTLGLNPKYAYFRNDCLYTGTLSEFSGFEGVWCLMTHCPDCFHEFLGFARVQNRSPQTGCPSTNCANNKIFRDRMTEQHRFLC